MPEQPAITAEVHPAPRRDKAGLVLLFFGLAAGPIVWSIHLVANYALASHSCFPDGAPRFLAPSGIGRVWLTLVAIDGLAMLVTAIAALISYRNWRTTRRETSEHASPAAGHANELVEIGEGRTRFLALWGMLTSAGFILTILFDLVGLFVLPLCR
jgi:hypothetical protein